jgi:hypothetical protein
VSKHPMLYTSLAKRPNGEIVPVWTDETNLIYFGGTPVEMPERGLFVWAAASDSRVGAIVQGHDPQNVRMARVVFDDGQVIDLHQSNGIQNVALACKGGTFIAAVVGRDERSWTTDYVESGKGFTTLLPMHLIGTSQGFLDWDGVTPVWTDEHRTHSRWGFPIWQPQTRGPWTVFQCVFRDTGDGIGARHEDGRVFRVSSFPSQIAPKIELNQDGVPVAAVSYEAPIDDLILTFYRWQPVDVDLLKPALPGQPPTPPVVEPPVPPKPEPPVVDPPVPPVSNPYKDGYAAGLEHGTRASVAKLASLQQALGACQAQLPTEPVFTSDEVMQIVNQATGKLPRFWQYLGVQGAVDKAVKAELRTK